MQILRATYREGFRYAKAEVMLLELGEKRIEQGRFFEDAQGLRYPQPEALMATLDWIGESLTARVVNRTAFGYDQIAATINPRSDESVAAKEHRRVAGEPCEVLSWSLCLAYPRE